MVEDRRVALALLVVGGPLDVVVVLVDRGFRRSDSSPLQGRRQGRVERIEEPRGIEPRTPQQRLKGLGFDVAATARLEAGSERPTGRLEGLALVLLREAREARV